MGWGARDLDGAEHRLAGTRGLGVAHCKTRWESVLHIARGWGNTPRGGYHRTTGVSASLFQKGVGLFFPVAFCKADLAGLLRSARARNG